MASPPDPRTPPDGGYLDDLPAPARYRGSVEAGEIEIVDPGEVREAEREASGGDAGAVGVVYDDRYIRVVRDPVLFPSGARGTYIRIFANPPLDGPSGAVVLPLLEGRVCLRKMFRHATRAWEYEAPRGARRPNDPSIEWTARRELREELGIDAAEVLELGTVYGDTGLIASSNAVFLAVLGAGELRPNPDAQEALGDVVALSREELFGALRSGEIRDGFTLSAVSLAIARGLL